MESSWTRDQIHVSCTGRWMLYWATSEAQFITSLLLFFGIPSSYFSTLENLLSFILFLFPSLLLIYYYFFFVLFLRDSLPSSSHLFSVLGYNRSREERKLLKLKWGSQRNGEKKPWFKSVAITLNLTFTQLANRHSWTTRARVEQGPDMPLELKDKASTQPPIRQGITRELNP